MWLSSATAQLETVMPTVYDFLRRYLLGNEAAESLQLCLDVLTARALGKSQQKIQITENGARPRGGQNASEAESIFENWRKPSPGYEPLLMKMGLDQFAARAIAKFAVRNGKQRARESKFYRQVSEDIRFFAKGPHHLNLFISHFHARDDRIRRARSKVPRRWTAARDLTAHHFTTVCRYYVAFYDKLPCEKLNYHRRF
jgi:hypothetical protein